MKHVRARHVRPAAAAADADTVAAAAAVMAADAEIAAIVVAIKRKVKGNFTQSARFGGRFFLREAPNRSLRQWQYFDNLTG